MWRTQTSHRAEQAILIVDEAHFYKKLEFETQMDNIKGLDKGASQRSSSLIMKARHIQEKTGGRKKQALLANSFEAIIAAVFLDGGYVAARAFVVRILATEIREATPKGSLDYKTLLQEDVQDKLRVSPRYRVVSEKGPDHEKVFEVEVTIGLVEGLLAIHHSGARGVTELFDVGGGVVRHLGISSLRIVGF